MVKNLISVLFICNMIVSCADSKPKSTRAVKPNVIVILTDDQGYQDVGCFGSTEIETPHLDKMAREGVRLTDFYAAQAVCSASRAGLLTGCYPNRIGIHGAFMPNSDVGLNTAETTMAEMLKDIDYETGIFGKWHLGDHERFMPNNQGFDEFFGIPYSNDMWPLHPQQGSVFNFGPLPLFENEAIIDTVTDQSSLTTQITEKSIEFIKKNKESPFFLYISHPQPHVPLYVSDKFKGVSKRGLYGDVMMEIDWSVGRILETLTAYDLDDNTIVIFTSDNGPWLSYGDHAGSADPLREGKGTALEGGQRVPCIVRYPQKISAGGVINIPMMAIDILPTIAEITGASLPDQKIDGKSVWDVWTGKSQESPQEAYYFYYHENELQGIRYGQWKLYYPHRYRTLNGRKGGENGLPVAYEYNSIKNIELYDLSTDLSESSNVAAAYPEVVEEILLLGNEIRIELGDQLTKKVGVATRPIGKID